MFVIWWYCCGANVLMTSLCWFLLMAEFFKNYLIIDCSLMTLFKWVKSLKTTSKASFFDADVNNDPAYLPAAVSAMAGGLWPSITRAITCYWLDTLSGKEKSWNVWKFLEHHWLFMINYKSIMWLNQLQITKLEI